MHIIILVVCCSLIVVAQNIENNLSGIKPEKILSRKRRYLTFPAGSSFQCVYDQTTPIIALPNYFTIGTTVAIAWPLPTEPLYKIHQQILDKFKMQEEKQIASMKMDLIQKRVDILANVTHEQIKSPLRSSAVNNVFMNPLTLDRKDWASMLQKFSGKRNDTNEPNKKASKPMRYYPAYGKRSIDVNYINHEDMFNAHQHRDTRQKLYSRIESFLNARGLNGASCVLRALCETNQRSLNREPGTFLQEILRAIFSLPAAVLRDEDILPHHSEYDIAHNENGECKTLYNTCKHSIWDSNFVF